eukprot:g5844.t1
MGSFSHQQQGRELQGREKYDQGNTKNQFLRSLRTLLLQIRTAGQLQKDFLVEKHFVELKDLCRSVCAELGTTAAVFDDLWTTVVRQRRGDASSSHLHGPARSLAQDAATILRAGEILREAAAASICNVLEHKASNNDCCASEARPSTPLMSSAHGDGTDKDKESSACCTPRQDVELAKDSSRSPKEDVAVNALPPDGAAGSVTFDNAADALPLLALAETLGVGNAVDACLDFIAAEKESVVAAAMKRFSSPEILGATSPAPSPPVDWALAVQRLAAWPRRSGDIRLLSSPGGGNEAKKPSPSSPPCSLGYECGSTTAEAHYRQQQAAHRGKAAPGFRKMEVEARTGGSESDDVDDQQLSFEEDRRGGDGWDLSVDNTPLHYHKEGYGGEGDVEAVCPGPRECSIKPSSEGAASVPVKQEDGGEHSGDDGERDDEISCALARKRALLRVRLARQRQELATAVVDANERGLRAERRRRREQKLAALLADARRGHGVDLDSGGRSGRQSARGRQFDWGKSCNEESGRGLGTTSMPSVTPRGKHAGSGGGGGREVATARRCGQGEEKEDDNGVVDDDDDDVVPREPLNVVPVESSTPVRGARSRCWRMSQKVRETNGAGMSPGCPSGAGSYPCPPSYQVGVWIDALYALEGMCESFNGKMLGGSHEPSGAGDALYLVLEGRCTQHRTATRRRHRGTRDVGRAPLANADQECRVDDWHEGVEAWIFRETVTLNVATAGGRSGRGGEPGHEVTLPGDDNDHDLVLRVCVAPPPASPSPSSVAQRRGSVLEETDAAALANGGVAQDEHA